MIQHLKLLEGKTLYLAGGTGFFGKALVHYLDRYIWSNPPVLILNSRGKRPLPTSIGNIKLVHDVCDLNDIDLFKFNRIDYVIHAANSTDAEANDPSYLKNTVIGTRSFFEKCSKIKLIGVLFVSSGAVYGINIQEKKKLSENSELLTDTEYGRAKLECETLAAEFSQTSGIPTSIARCFSFSGIDLDITRPYAITSFLRQARDKNAITIQGSGNAIRSYLDQDDLAAWLLEILLLNTSMDIFNIGSPEAVSILDLAKTIAKLTHSPDPVLLNDSTERENFYVPLIIKAEKKFSLETTISLEESLRKMIRLHF